MISRAPVAFDMTPSPGIEQARGRCRRPTRRTDRGSGAPLGRSRIPAFRADARRDVTHLDRYRRDPAALGPAARHLSRLVRRRIRAHLTTAPDPGDQDGGVRCGHRVALGRRERRPPAGRWSPSRSSSVMLALVAFAAHARLAGDRPKPARLTIFYLVVAVGGACGGLLNGVLAPLVFDRVLEYPLLIIIVPLLLLGLGKEGQSAEAVEALPRAPPRRGREVLAPAAIVALVSHGAPLVSLLLALAGCSVLAWAMTRRPCALVLDPRGGAGRSGGHVRRRRDRPPTDVLRQPLDQGRRRASTCSTTGRPFTGPSTSGAGQATPRPTTAARDLLATSSVCARTGMWRWSVSVRALSRRTATRGSR